MVEHERVGRRRVVTPQSDLRGQLHFGSLRARKLDAQPRREVRDARAREHEGAAARKHLTDGQFSAISWLVIAMNAFNRVSIVSQHPVRKDRGEPGRRQAG